VTGSHFPPPAGFPRRCAGFSLLEVLVAFAILALALGVLFQIFGLGMRNTVLAEEYSRATLLAESKLAAVGVETPLEQGASGGTIDDKYSWRATVQPHVMDQEESALPQRFQPVDVTVEVFWGAAGREHSVALSTLRLVSSQP
jgi:general secretion pathway protein I